MIHPLITEGYSRPKIWCVPTAIALLTGIPLVTAAETVARTSGEAAAYSDMSGHHTGAFVLAMGELGYCCKQVRLADRYPGNEYGVTLKRYMTERRRFDIMEELTPTAIFVHGHILTGHYGMLFDNWVPKGATVDRFPKTSRLVNDVYIITKQGA